MIVDFEKLNLTEKPMLILRTPDKTAIQTLGYAFNVSAELSYNEVSTLTFDLPLQVNGVKTPHYDDVVGMKIIDLKDCGQFILVDPEESSNGISTIKSCKAYSLEYEFTKKNIYLEEGTYNFWDPFNKENTILGRIAEKMINWSIGDVDSSLIGKYRTFDEINENVYNFIKGSVQETFGCVFDFDTYNRTINVVSVDSEVEQKQVYLSQERLIKEIKIEEDSDNIVTCLDVRGSDDVSIRGVNPLGTNKIYNLDYFMNTSNFSQSTIDKWEMWKSDFEDAKESYYLLSINSNLKTSRVLAEQAILSTLQGELTVLENEQAAIVQAISQGLGTNSELRKKNKEIADKKNEINTQEKLIETINSEIETVQKSLKSINDSISMSKYFSEEELLILENYFFEGSVEEKTFVATSTASYNNEDISNSIEDGETFSITKSSIRKVTPSNTKTMYVIESGSLSIDDLSAEIISATVEFNSDDNTFIFTAYLNNGTIGNGGDEEFNTANVTLIGSYKSYTQKSDSLLFAIYNGLMYFTKDSTEYEFYTIERDLLEYGLQVLAEKSEPSYHFSVDAGNFLAIKDFEVFKNELSLGKRIYLNLDKNEVLRPYVTAVKISFEDLSDFSLEFSSNYTSSNKAFKLAQLLEDSVSMGKSLSLKGGTYSSFVTSGASTRVKNFMDSALDISKNTVLSSGYQAIEFGDAGIRVRKWKTDVNGNITTDYEPEEIWIVDNMIAFTEDNWDTSCMAIGKIFDENMGEYKAATSTYDSTKIYYYRVGDSAPYTYKPYTYNQSTWGNDYKNLYCRKGTSKYGIAAPYLVGKILAGENLYIDTEGGYFRVDGNGAYLLNEKFVIASSNGNGLTFDSDKGLVHKVTDKDGVEYEAGFGAGATNEDKYGLYFKIGGKDKLYYDVEDTQLVVNGSIYAKNLYLGDNRRNVLELCNNSDGGTNNDYAEKYKIKGDYIEGRGLRAYDDYGNLRVEISGEDGSIDIKNGSISLTNGRNNININPNAGIVFEASGTEVVNINIADGTATFGGTISTTKDAKIGKTLQLINPEDSDDSDYYLSISNGGITGDRVSIQTSNLRTIEIRCGKLLCNDKRVLTESDLDTIENRVRALENRLNNMMGL